MIKEANIEEKKEPRRAKRKKDWLKNNLPPLSTKDAKSVRNKTYREKLKREKEAPKRFDVTYKQEMYNYVSSQFYNVKGSFTYRKNVSTYKCFKDATFILEQLYLNGIIRNYYFVVDYEPQHAHTHFIINAVNPKQVNAFLYNLFNRYDQGKVWSKIIEGEEKLRKAIKYCTDKLDGKLAIRQLSIDYWGIRLMDKVSEIELPILPVADMV